jgi:hypothetical protein
MIRSNAVRTITVETKIYLTLEKNSRGGKRSMLKMKEIISVDRT